MPEGRYERGERERIGQPAAPVIRGPAAGAVTPGTGASDQIAQDRYAQESKSRALFESLIHTAQNESLESVGFNTNPAVSQVFGGNVIVSFTVPNGQIAMIDRVAVDYSNPVYAVLGGWNIHIDGGAIPNLIPSFAGGISMPFFSTMSAGVGEPVRISAIYLQAEQVVSLVVADTTQAVVVTGRISGRIIRPATPLLMGANI